MIPQRRPPVRSRFGTRLVALMLLAATAACASDDEPVSVESAAPVSPPPTPPLTAGPPSEEDLAPGWDEPGDGPSPEPIERLSEDELRRLLRTRASVPTTADSCGSGEVEAALVGFDVALGHRYTSLKVRNTSEVPCEVEGVPGVGARGLWGSTFQLTVEPGLTNSTHRGPVTLAPGQEALATVEWTGALAGAEEERAATLVVQLAQGQVPLAVPALLPPEAGPVDIGMMTTLRVGPFVPGG